MLISICFEEWRQEWCSKWSETWILIQMLNFRRNNEFYFCFLKYTFSLYIKFFILKISYQWGPAPFLWNKLSKLSSAETVLPKLKVSEHRRYENSIMVTLLGNSDSPKCRSSRATERVSNILNAATVTLSRLQHGFVTRNICEANPDFTRKYPFGIFYYSLRNINHAWLLKDFFDVPKWGKSACEKIVFMNI